MNNFNNLIDWAGFIVTTKEIAIIAFVLYALGVTLYIYLFTKKLKKWPYVLGELAEISIVPTYEIRTVAGRVRYTYEVNGVVYKGKRLSPWSVTGHVKSIISKQMTKIEYVPKDQVKVFYNPKNPSKSYLVRESFLEFLRCWIK